MLILTNHDACVQAEVQAEEERKRKAAEEKAAREREEAAARKAAAASEASERRIREAEASKAEAILMFEKASVLSR